DSLRIELSDVLTEVGRELAAERAAGLRLRALSRRQAVPGSAPGSRPNSQPGVARTTRPGDVYLLAARSVPRADQASLAVDDDPVGQTVVDGFLGAERPVTVGVRADLRRRVAGVLAEDLVDLGPYLGHLLGLDGEVRQRAPGLAGRLVQHHLGV